MEKNKFQKNRTSKKVSSIAHKLHRQILFKKLGLYLASDLFLAVVLIIGWILLNELDSFGHLLENCDRSFVTDGSNIFSLTYLIKRHGKVLFQKEAWQAFFFFLGALILSILFQFLNLGTASYGEYRKIKKILSPLNDLALKVDEMSHLTFDGSKYHKIENALTSISPEEMQTLSLGDEDLLGIEMAMNNMLKRMHDVYQQQSRFVDDASHELRTPIAVIQGYANMLDRWGKTDTDILDESITAIKHESEHMNHLVEQLLFLARGDNGRNIMHFEEVSLPDLMQEIYEESLMIDEDHVYRFETNSSPLILKADASMLKQAIRILVDNASKYTKKGDEIRLSIGRTPKGQPYLQVQDCGIGMSEADISHMFERFYRSDHTRKIKGSGLGLSIAKWIISKHDGYFEILSRTELGTRIRVILPDSHI